MTEAKLWTLLWFISEITIGIQNIIISGFKSVLI
jgi:hypothetical protein